MFIGTVSHSQVSSQSAHETMREFIRPKECKDYVMEEPLQPHSLTFSVFQEHSETYDLFKRGANSNNRHGSISSGGSGFRKLYYQNAIFVGFTSTFQQRRYALNCILRHRFYLFFVSANLS